MSQTQPAITQCLKRQLFEANEQENGEEREQNNDEKEEEEEEDPFTSDDATFMETVFSTIFFPIIKERAKGSPSLMCYDGEFDHIEATFTALIPHLKKESVPLELLKLPASTSLLYQPTMLCEATALVKSIAYHNDQDYDAPKWISDTEKLMQNLGISPASQKTFRLFFCQIHMIISKAFQSQIITSGYSGAGIYPLNYLKMLNKIPAYRNLPDEEAFRVIDAIISLCQIAKEKGYLLDSEIKEALGDLDITAVEIPSNAMNAQRA